MSYLVWMIVASGLLPRPMQPSPPTSPPVIDAEPSGDADDTVPEEPMSDDELEQLSVSIDPIAIEVTQPLTQAEPHATVEPRAPSELPTSHKASDRSVDEAFPARPPKETCPPGEAGLPATGALAPSLIAPRWEPGAALLGGLIGFGTGHFYAGAPKRGLAMGIADTLLLGGLAGSIWALNEHVVREDRHTGLSLARGERDRDGAENAFTGLAWGLGVAAGVSRIFQAFDAYRAAAHTNEEIHNVSFVPLARVTPLRGGGAVALGFTW